MIEPARPPRLAKIAPTEIATSADVEYFDGKAYLEKYVLEDGPDVLADVRDLQLDGVAARWTSLGGQRPRTLDIALTTFEGCDLSAERFGNVNRATFTGCKLLGADFSAGRLSDVVFERCVIRMANFRMATLERVAFVDCELVEVDAFELTATDVSFAGSRIERLNVDRLNADRVDLRGVTALSFDAVGRLDGCLVDESQLPMLAYELAAAVGLSIDTGE